MQNKKYFGYLLAVITIVVYEFWYFGSNFITSTNPNASLIIPLLIIFSICVIISIIFELYKNKRFLEIKRRSDLLYPILAGIVFAFGNYLFYFVINYAGIPAASAFTTAEIVVFSFLLLLVSKNKNTMSFLLMASIFIALGMILESLKIEYGNIVLNTTTLFVGVVIAVLYGAATYLYYASLEHIEKKMSSITIIFITELVVFSLIALIMSFNNSIVLPNFNIYYILAVGGLGIILFLTAWLDATIMKVLLPFGEEAVATGYIISDMQLLPIIIYTIFAFPSEWYLYATGLALVVIGILLLDWF